jgi:hypothetical protein
MLTRGSLNKAGQPNSTTIAPTAENHSQALALFSRLCDREPETKKKREEKKSEKR